MRVGRIAILLGAGMLASGTGAQGLGGLAGGLGGGLGGGGIGGMLSGVGGATAGNAAGLLGYCLKNKLLGGAAATSSAGSVLGKLTGRKEITASPGFAAGQQGQLVTGQGQGMSLAGVKDQIKGKVCDMVLQRAQSFL